MTDYNIWGQPMKVNRKNNPISFDINLGLPNTKTKKERDKRRSFGDTQRKEILYQQNYKCASSDCNHDILDPRATQYDHNKPWSEGGRTITQNGRALCSKCHDIKTHKERLKKINKEPKQQKSNSPFGTVDFGLNPLKKQKSPFKF